MPAGIETPKTSEQREAGAAGSPAAALPSSGFPARAAGDGSCLYSRLVESFSSWFLPASALLTAALWFFFFPLQPIPLAAAVFELLPFLAAAAGVRFAARFGVKPLEVGWNLLAYGFLLSLLSRLAGDPLVLETVAELVTGAAVIAAALGWKQVFQRAVALKVHVEDTADRMAARDRELSTLNRISEIARGPQPLRAALREIVEEIGNATEFPIVSVELYDEGRQVMVFEAGKGLPSPASGEPLTIPVGQTLSGVVVIERRPVYETRLACRPEQTHPALTQLGGRTYVGVPLLAGGEAIGAISLIHAEEVEVTARLKRFVANFAMLVALLVEHRRAQELRESAERLALALRGANDGVWDCDLRTQECYFSERWHAMLGFRGREEARCLDDWLSRVHPDECDGVRRALEAHVDGESPYFEVEHRVLHGDGGYRWMLSRGLAFRDDQGQVYRMAGSQTDVTGRKEAEAQLLHDAFHDALTGLPNRALFMDGLARACGRASRNSDSLFAVLFLDLDRFKVLNDSRGHLIGDQLLLAIAKRLEESIRPGDMVARLGGDEFTILLEDLSEPNEASEIADRIQTALSRRFRLGQQDVYTSASIGIALSSAPFDRPHDLLRNADTAMYRAKTLGRARSSVFEAGMHTRARRTLELETALRGALQRSEFAVYYQPILSLVTREVVGFEALLRWLHPEQGLISPESFIPLAEETGLIVSLGDWLLDEACRQTVKWQQSGLGRLFISANISPRQLHGRVLTDGVSQVLAKTGLEPHRLQLEVTESTLMENSTGAGEVLEQLRQAGVRIAIDDFGTGYSSLSYLTCFPVHTLKIDRSFVRQVWQRPSNAAIVRAVVTLAKSLQLKVTAEGVETEDELRFVTSAGCAEVQGFYYSLPAPAELATKLLEAQPTTGRAGEWALETKAV